MTREELRAVIAAAIKDATSIGGAPNKPCVIGHFSAADAALAAIEAAGVRLVPSEATAEMVNGAVSRRFKSYLTKSDDMYADIYRAMLDASPYTPQKETK